nr:phage tail protein [Kibdelosporangium sp. MJ126-NF4]CEL20679.1 hypothetical protein [Kibdelosporangium sp. MJ126-NF4]CTQ89592.1 hypothetical protein [Kibdelosporangium sp. MJ126-NF4]
MSDVTATNIFVIEADGIELGTFMKCSGVVNESEVIEHKELNKEGRMMIIKTIGALKWSDITLERRVDADTGLWEWRKEIIQGDITKARRNGSIVAKNSKMEEVARWNFTNAWISKWEGSELSADANSVSTEKVTITHEGLERV